MKDEKVGLNGKKSVFMELCLQKKPETYIYPHFMLSKSLIVA